MNTLPSIKRAFGRLIIGLSLIAALLFNPFNEQANNYQHSSTAGWQVTADGGSGVNPPGQG